MILNRKIKRDFRENFVRNGAMILIIMLSMTLVVSLCSSTECITDAIMREWEQCCVEDGAFETYAPLSKRNLKELSEIDVSVEEMFYSDISINSGQSVLRIFPLRQRINLPYVEEGRMPEKRGEIFLEKNFALTHKLSVGDSVSSNAGELIISATGCLPDYCYVKQNTSDVAANDEFTVAVVCKEDFADLCGNGKIIYNYAYRLGEGCGARELKDKLQRLKFNKSEIRDTYLKAHMESGIVQEGTLSSFDERKYNIRINDALDDSKIAKQSALVSGVIMLILLVYMLSIFASGTIEKERFVIGTLYALGYTKKGILSHYMKTPLIISVSGAALGVVGGFSLTGAMSSSYVAMYSFPAINNVYPPYLLAYALGMPVVFSYLVNRYVLSKKLSATPLKMMRDTPLTKGAVNPGLKNVKYETKYKIRQFLRELGGNITLFFGVTLSLLLIILSVACYGSISVYIEDITKDVNFSYMYILRNPVTDLPKKACVGYTRGFYVDYPMTGGEMEVTLLGVDSDNPYFSFSPYLSENEDEIYVSDSARIKFGYKPGDKVVLKDNANDKMYAFTVADEVKYGNGLYFFMNINAMRKAFGQAYFDKEDLKKGERMPKTEDYYYNAVFSDKKLEFKHNMMLSEVSKAEMKSGADKFMVLMFDMIVMLIGVSVIIFIAVMYLLMKLEIDRSSFSVSLLKALGYPEKTVNSFYIGSSFYITAAAVIFGIPLCRVIVGYAYPFCVSNVNAGFEAKISPLQYVIVAAIVICSYAVTRMLLLRYLRKIKITDILKNRE